MKLFMLALTLLSSSAFASPVLTGEISRAADLPSRYIDCALVRELLGVVATLEFRDGGTEEGKQYLNGTLSFMRHNGRADILGPSRVKVYVDRAVSNIVAVDVSDGTESTASGAVLAYFRPHPLVSYAISGIIGVNVSVNDRTNAVCEFRRR